MFAPCGANNRMSGPALLADGARCAPSSGQDPSLRCKRYMGGNGKVEGRACPAPTDCHKWVVHERGKGGRQPVPFAVGGWLPGNG